MAAKEPPGEDAGTQDKKAFSGAWLKPFLVVLGILGGLAVNGLITALVFHFTVTRPTARAIERARSSIEANATAKTKDLEEVMRTLAPKPAPPVEQVTPVEETPPPAVLIPMKPAQQTPKPSPHSLSAPRPAGVKPTADYPPGKPQQPPADPNK